MDKLASDPPKSNPLLKVFYNKGSEQKQIIDSANKIPVYHCLVQSNCVNNTRDASLWRSLSFLVRNVIIRVCWRRALKIGHSPFKSPGSRNEWNLALMPSACQRSSSRRTVRVLIVKGVFRSCASYVRRPRDRVA